MDGDIFQVWYQVLPKPAMQYGIELYCWLEMAGKKLKMTKDCLKWLKKKKRKMTKDCLKWLEMADKHWK